MSDTRLSALPDGPFARLANLLGDEKPGKEPISLALGDPSGAVPAFVEEALAREAARFGNYPAIAGTEEWRQAAAGWVGRRFGLPAERIDPERHVLPLNGTRDGLFSVLFPFMPQSKAGKRPIVAMPNPFYQVYAAAALASGAEPLYVPALAAIRKALWRMPPIGANCSIWPSVMISSCWPMNAMPTFISISRLSVR